MLKTPGQGHTACPEFRSTLPLEMATPEVGRLGSRGVGWAQLGPASGKRRRQESLLRDPSSGAQVRVPWRTCGVCVWGGRLQGELVSQPGWEDTLRRSWHFKHGGDTSGNAPNLLFASVSVFSAAPVVLAGICFSIGAHLVTAHWARAACALFCLWFRTSREVAPTGCPWSRGDGLLAAPR